MKDHNGKIVHELEIIRIVGRPDISDPYTWAVFDIIECRNFTDFVLINCCTDEIMILPQANIERSY